MTDVDAVVAGARLSAARGLVAAQRTVTVLEARDRVTGRNHGFFFSNGVPVEMDGITDLAAQARLSPRHLQRRFTAEMGVPPAAYVERVRIEAARRALAEADDPVHAVARRCGFGTAETLRRVFQRRLGLAPSGYRDRFRITPLKECS